MKAMGYWDTDLCPCCRKVPELSTTHLFLCDDPTIASTRHSKFHAILDWMSSVDTAPLLQEIITVFWHGKSPKLEADAPYIYREVYMALREMGVGSMWMGLLPIHIIDIQEQYYRLYCSRRRCITWVRDLVGKMLRASLDLCLTRIILLNAKTESGL